MASTVVAQLPEPIKYEETIDQSTACNCYKTAEVYLNIDLPPMAKIQPNTEDPIVGSVAIMFYGSVKHVAVIKEITVDGYVVHEANYTHCKIKDRFIPKNYSRLVGFYTAG